MIKKLKKFDKKLQSIQEENAYLVFEDLEKVKYELLDELYLEDEEESLQINQNIQKIDQSTVNFIQKYKAKTREVVEKTIDQALKDQNNLYKDFFGLSLLLLLLGSDIFEIKIRLLQEYERLSDPYFTKYYGYIQEKIKTLYINNDINNRSYSEFRKSLDEIISKEDANILKAVTYFTQMVYNKLIGEVLLKVDEREPGRYKKKWWSVLDKKTTPVCNALDGQIKEINEPFEDPLSGSLFMYPPAVYGNPSLKPQFHYCRSIATPWI
jgi:Fe2+ transport system protein B